MFCKRCGNKLEFDHKYCGNCGLKVEVNSVGNIVNTNMNTNMNTNTNTNTNINSNYINNNINLGNNYNQNINYNKTYNNVPKKNNFAKVLIVFLVIIGFILGSVFVINGAKKIFGSSDVNQLVKENGTRTIMVYIIGSDLESYNGSATSDIDEMLNSKFNEDDVNLLLYVGGSKKWKNSMISNKENAIYEVSDGNLHKVKSYKLSDMTDGKNLTEFIDYGYENYKTDLYDLILWDHGGGPIFGYGSDENYKNSIMSLVELDLALNNSKLMKETKFEMIGFDACLMSSIEIANALKETANYFVASSELEPGSGWDYGFLSKVDADLSSVDLGKNIVDSYVDYYEKVSSLSSLLGYNHKPLVTLSLIDLRKVNNLVTEVDSWVGDLDTSISISDYSKYSRGATRATNYGYVENETIQYDLIDLYDFVDEVEQNDKTKTVKKKINEAVIYERGTIEDCYGLSIYFPTTSRNYYSSFKPVYKEVAISKKYLNFLDSYVKVATGDRIVKSNINKILPTTDSDNNIYAVLPDDVVNNYAKAGYFVFKKMEDGSMLPIYTSSAVQFNGNRIEAVVSDRRIVVSDLNSGEPLDVIAVEMSKDDDSVTYSLVTMLQNWDDDDFINTFKTEVVEIYLKVDNETGEGKIIDIRSVDDATTVVGKITYNLNDWKYMVFATSSYHLYDEEGNKLEEWLKTGDILGTEISIQDGYKFSALSLDENSEYYYMFRITDTQGNTYETELVKAK